MKRKTPIDCQQQTLQPSTKRKNQGEGSQLYSTQQQHREQDKQYKCEQSVRYNLDFNNQDCPLVSWYDWNEWLFVKRNLFSDDGVWMNNSPTREKESLREKSIEILGVWKSKFRIQTSTIVESSYLFLEALKIDQRIDSKHNRLNIKSIKEQALSNAIVRFVNLFSKDGKKTQSSSLALGSRQADCPKLLVDVRNEISHRKFPSIEILENCAKQALKWMKTKYWDNQEEYILNFQKEWIQYSNQYIIQFNKRKELPQVEEAFDKKEKQRRKEKIEAATKELEKIEERILQHTRGPSCSFIVQSFLLAVLVSPQYNTAKTKPDHIVNKLRPLIDFLDERLDFIPHLLKQIIILIRDFVISTESHSMFVCGVEVTCEMIELCFSYFDTLLRIFTKKQKTNCSVVVGELSHQIEISNSEFLDILKTTMNKHASQYLNNQSSTLQYEYGIGSFDSVLSYHLLDIKNIDNQII
ncbi:predicted protein [Naegleria gruberi]|uniref:Predicted protein n=1 Tax=Naegleria gruberi TaxID=5762 RepID=D2UYC3_NAEGR|nr:uncharacterized protein NAEGRDRAFT_45140 [Naegleria gruberi]EFC50767.1 predicted protein [Naegleria gruberi]|eukprot:XP_002683511.1 predicted protein [Naegleria gruberi strain NEG-M]